MPSKSISTPKMNDMNDILVKAATDLHNLSQFLSAPISNNFEDALKPVGFFVDYERTNQLIKSAEDMVHADIDKLYTDARTLLSAVDDYENVDKSKWLSVDYKALVTEHLRPFEEEYEYAKARSTELWRKYSQMSNRMDYLPLDSDEYRTLEKDCDFAHDEYSMAKADTLAAYDRWEAERHECAAAYSFRFEHLDILMAKIRRIAESIIRDIEAARKEGRI